MRLCSWLVSVVVVLGAMAMPARVLGQNTPGYQPMCVSNGGTELFGCFPATVRYEDYSGSPTSYPSLQGRMAAALEQHRKNRVMCDGVTIFCQGYLTQDTISWFGYAGGQCVNKTYGPGLAPQWGERQPGALNWSNRIATYQAHIYATTSFPAYCQTGSTATTTLREVTTYKETFNAIPYCPYGHRVVLEFPDQHTGNLGYFCAPLQQTVARSSLQRGVCEDGPRSSCALAGNPVDLLAGRRKVHHEVDLVVAGDFPIVWDRSFLQLQPSEGTGQSPWRFARIRRAEISLSAGSNPSVAWVTRADGAVLVFKAPATGGDRAWTMGWGNVGEDFQIRTLRSRLTDWKSGAQWLGVVLHNDQGEQEFYNPAGQLVKVVNEQGQRHDYSYNEEGLLVRIAQSNGRFLDIAYQGLPTLAQRGTVVSVAYDENPDATPAVTETPVTVLESSNTRTDVFYQPVVASVSDGQRTVEYVWERQPGSVSSEVGQHPAMLVGVQRPNGGITTYHYENPGANQWTGVTDADAKRMGTYVYDGEFSVSEEWKGPGPDAATPSTKVDRLQFSSQQIVDGLGNVTDVAIQGVYSGVADRLVGYSRDCPSCSGDRDKNRTYNALGQLERSTDFVGTHTDFTYTSEGRVATRTEAAGTPEVRTTTFTWVPGHNLPLTQTEPVLVGATTAQRTTTWSYNARNQPTSRTVSVSGSGNGASRQWTYGYDSYHRLAMITDPAGTVTRLYYNPEGDLVAQEEHAGTPAMRTTRWGGYQPDGLPRWTINEDGLATTLAWDLDGNLLETRQGEAASPADLMLGTTAWAPTLSGAVRRTATTYSEAGRPLRQELPDGTVMTFAYDAAGRLTTTAVLGTDGTTTSTVGLTYDAMSNVTRTEIKNGDGELVQAGGATYDALSRVRQGLNAQQDALYTQTYDEEHRPTVQDDVLSRQRSQAYDALGRLTQQIDAAGHPATLTHGPQDEVRTATDPRGVVTTYAYNGFGDLVQLASPDRGTWTFGYDPAGRLTSTTDPRGVVTTTTYDSASRPSTRTFSDAGTTASTGFHAGTVVQAFGYDACNHGKGRLCSTVDSSGTTSYVYNAWGDVIGKAWTGKAGGPAEGVTLSTGYGYDVAKGRLSSITFPSGTTQHITYGVDGNPVSLSYGGRLVVANARWTAAGQIAGWAWPQAAGWSGIHDHVSFSYDLDGRPVAIEDLDSRSLVWDAGDRLVGVDDANDAASSQVYGYDALDRLTSADIGFWNAPIGFTYDAVGNRTALTDGNTGDAWQYAYGLSHNRLVTQTAVSNGTPGQAFTASYDAMGNLVTDGIGLQLSYDATGRLVQGGKGPQSMTAAYNALGQRMLKASGSTVRVYAVDEAGRPLGVYVLDSTATAGFRTEEEYVHLDGWRPVAVVRPDANTGMANPQIFPILTDHLGTPRKVLDGNTGDTRWSWDAKQPFGHEMPNETPTAGQAAFTFDLRFPGQRYDEETGLFHNGFRDYHAGLGRYVQSDPLGLEAGWNTFSYVDGNPFSATDPVGLKKYLWIEGPNYGTAAGAMPFPPTKSSADEKHFEPAGHISVGVGDPIKAYRTYSFGVDGFSYYGLHGSAYVDQHGGGEIYEAYEITDEQLRFIDLDLRSYVRNYTGPYGPLNTCRTFTRERVQYYVRKFSLVKAKNHPTISVPSASRHPK